MTKNKLFNDPTQKFGKRTKSKPIQWQEIIKNQSRNQWNGNKGSNSKNQPILEPFFSKKKCDWQIICPINYNKKEG